MNSGQSFKSLSGFILKITNSFNCFQTFPFISLCRYGGFSLGARSTQVLPPANEIDDAIERVRKIFELQKVSQTLYMLLLTPTVRQTVKQDTIRKSRDV